MKHKLLMCLLISTLSSSAILALPTNLITNNDTEILNHPESILNKYSDHIKNGKNNILSSKDKKRNQNVKPSLESLQNKMAHSSKAEQFNKGDLIKNKSKKNSQDGEDLANSDEQDNLMMKKAVE